jgi:broad specificity phosphatase PhoE
MMKRAAALAWPGLMIMIFMACRSDNMQEEQRERLIQFYEEWNAQAPYVEVENFPVARKLRFIEEKDSVVPDYGQLRQIALIRHGEPDIIKTGSFSFKEAKEYMQAYDSVGIILPDEPFFEVEDSDSVAFFASTIPRAQATAKYLFGAERDIVSSSDFREFERSLGNRRMPMRLPLKYWTVGARIQWFLGINLEGIESFGEARARAREAARMLDSVSVEKEKVVLVAHGMFNRFVARYLRKHGWTEIREGDDGYLSTIILARFQEPVPDTVQVQETPIVKESPAH